jgi:hypothetical protein
MSLPFRFGFGFILGLPKSYYQNVHFSAMVGLMNVSRLL